MKYIDADKLKAEIYRRYEENRKRARYDDYYRGMNDGLDYLEQFIDSLPEQPASEGLEDEIERVCAEIEEKNPQHRGLKPSGIAKIARHFAEWDRAKMLEGAVEGKVFMSFAPGHNQVVMADIDLPTNTKVKIIIVKEEEK